MNKSAAMIIRNKAAKAARDGKLDINRVNRAFGIIQSKDAAAHLSKYHANTKSCNCPDHAKTDQPCKHMIAAMMQVRVAQLEAKS